ncbi:hypothetical protein KUCAC02_015845 [Chaenocephalus aceratus]|uniref:Uncharacterized protein n=1 Tax=Chaenocephalus aceratus TaxID=36190 RepID=A0ACB9XZK2_CHAAC|nr:hypothetical protein KUCAC02_015845 [Chaenocephalus aceratus]
MTCNSLDFMADGHSIISAWNDGKIRVFAPESGRLMLTIDNAHRMGVTAIAGTKDCKRIVSGGGSGQVRVWELQPPGHQLLETMKEHKATVTCIKIKSDDKECVTASSDGACIIWDLVRFASLQMVIASTMFRTVCYHPEEYQLITGGTDRKDTGALSGGAHTNTLLSLLSLLQPFSISQHAPVAYWDVYDGSAIRELDGSQAGAINGMDITQDGKHFVTGGDDKLVKVWDYLEGTVTHVGIAHSGSITSIKVCSNNRTLVSTSADGAILRWRFPPPASS